MKLVHLVGFIVKKRRAYLNLWVVSDEICVACDSGMSELKMKPSYDSFFERDSWKFRYFYIVWNFKKQTFGQTVEFSLY